MTTGSPSVVEDRTPVRWGAALGAVALGAVAAAFAFGYLYLWANADAWPPSGAQPPPVGAPAIAGALTLGAAVANMVGVRRRHLGLHAGLGAAWLLGSVAVGVLWQVTADMAMTATDHAYGSISTVMLGAWVVALCVAAAGSLLVHVRVVTGAPVEWLLSGRLATTAFWVLALVVGIMALATAVTIPHVAAR